MGLLYNLDCNWCGLVADLKMVISRKFTDVVDLFDVKVMLGWKLLKD